MLENLGFIVGFILLASTEIWLLIESRAKLIFKILLIPILLWYGTALYYAVPSLMGWPAKAEIPGNSYVLAIRIKEPNPMTKNPGAIYFWVNPKPDENKSAAFALINPKTALNYFGGKSPRAYELPYTRGMHKAIIEAQKKAQGIPGAKVKIKKEGKPRAGNSGQESSKAPLEFEIVNPLKLMPK